MLGIGHVQRGRTLVVIHITLIRIIEIVVVKITLCTMCVCVCVCVSKLYIACVGISFSGASYIIVRVWYDPRGEFLLSYL